MTNPFVDDYADRPPIETPTTEVVRASQAPPLILQRKFAAATAKPMDGSITHSPLLFEDSFADIWTDDDTFQWTGEDWVQWMVWRARFFVNMTAVGFSWVTTPPWSVMTSDGRPSRSVIGQQYDAELQ